MRFVGKFLRPGRLLNQISWKISFRQCHSAVKTLLLPMGCILSGNDNNDDSDSDNDSNDDR